MLLLLFSWPPACTVWPNYEVVLLQPWSGTAPSLGSVSNITSYINPAPLSNCLMGPFPSPSVSWFPPPSATLILRCTALLAPDSPPYLPVFDRMSTWTDVHSRRTPSPILISMSFRPRPSPRVPLGPYSPTLWAYFCRLFPRLFSPLSPPSTRGSIPAKVGFWVGLRIFSYVPTPTKITNSISETQLSGPKKGVFLPKIPRMWPLFWTWKFGL